jgi:hypothetical protein
MPAFKLRKKDYTKIQVGEGEIELIKKDKFDSFSESILGLGKIGSESYYLTSLSVMFDLEGFTIFCKQMDPQLTVPNYLDKFLKWIFKQIKEVIVEKKYPEGYSTYTELPFLAKYLGDGVLFIWDVEGYDDVAICNVIIGMHIICANYREKFLPTISSKIVSPPPKLRCGIARGTIYSVGAGNDYVGPCINLSSRLQKFNKISFCFSVRGINIDQFTNSNKKKFLVKKVSIRGLGDDELVCVLKDEYDLLDESDKSIFLNP